MIRTIASSLVCVGLAAPAAAQTALPKEGPVELTQIFQSTLQTVVLDKEFTQFAYEAYGSTLAAKEGGFGDRVTGRCLGSSRVIKGKLETEIGGCEYTDRSGDKFYYAYTGSATDMPGTAIIKGTYIGGTGKYAGITGAAESRRQILPSPGAGRGASVSHTKGAYKLP